MTDTSPVLPDVSEAEARVVELKSGRRLGYGEWGDPQGTPAFAFHGTPGSRILFRAFNEAAQNKRVRLIGVDRPGYGLSDLVEDRKVLGFAEDVEELADMLQLDRYGVMGASGGSPYALACAHRFPGRVFGALVISGVGPPESWDETFLENAKQAPANPEATKASLQQFSETARDNRSSLAEVLLQGIDESGRSVAESKPELIEAFIDHHLEGQRKGPEGTIVEQQLLLEPWGFNVDDIRVPVRFWCGGKDVLLPHVQWMAAKIPGARLTVKEEAGHIDGLWITDQFIDMLLDCLDSQEAL